MVEVLPLVDVVPTPPTKPSPPVPLPNVKPGVPVGVDLISCSEPPEPGLLAPPPSGPPSGPPPAAPSFTSPNAFSAAVLNVGSVMLRICCCQSAAKVSLVRTNVLAAWLSAVAIAIFC